MSLFYRKPHAKHVRQRQAEAERALKVSQQTADLLDEMETEVLTKMRMLRKLNQENNFSARLAAVYGGDAK